MRLLILTDSLGCPRREIPVEKTWTELIINKYKSRFTIYTMCKHGLSSRDIDYQYIEELKPDVIVCQIGIVDACRRALPTETEKCISGIPIVRSLVRRFCSRFHYYITQRFNIHRVDIASFKRYISHMKSLSPRIALIAIASPGDYLQNKTFNVVEDVHLYNKGLEDIVSDGLVIINPYNSTEKKAYTLPCDGHHLNEYGNKLVYNAVCSYLDTVINSIDG